MLRISEHFEFYNEDHLSAFQKVECWEQYYNLLINEDRVNFMNNKHKTCLIINLQKQEEVDEFLCNIKSSYYIGLDKLKKLNLNVYVEPKLNNHSLQVDYINMLLDALKAPENFDHLDGLIETKFQSEWIEIKSDLKPILTPFLIAQFLSIVQSLVKKGLKKSYYSIQENLNSRVKGKILLSQQIKFNLFKNRSVNTFCQYQEFGVDTESNQFLKYILFVIENMQNDFSSEKQIKQLSEIQHYCKGGFYNVSNKSFKSLKYKETNPFYRNYNLAISLGNQILALNDYNISSQNNREICKHPPFWIDMSKLFELYVFKKLKEQFPQEGHVKYHEKHNHQEIDFIINSQDIKAVVDAKYKPRYANGNPSMEDARQLSGYTRLKSIYRELNIKSDILIPAYLIYPANLQEDNLVNNKEVETDLSDIDSHSKRILKSKMRKSSTYQEMFLQEIELPQVIL